MRSGVILNFIKKEWYDGRRMLFWYFLTSLILNALLIICTHQEGVLNWVKQAGISFEDFSMFSFAVFFMPYAVSWMMLFSKTGKESRAGFYSFLHKLPLTVKEIVSAKYISSFLMNGLMAGWLCGLWWIYEMNFPQAASLTAWAALCMVVFLFAFCVLALELGMFFRWGDSNLSFVFLLLLIIVLQFGFVGQLADQTIRLMGQNPLMLWGAAILSTVCIWIICWRWSVKAYRKY